MASTPGFEPGTHWWDGSALTTALSLLPNIAWRSKVVYLTCTFSLWSSVRSCKHHIRSLNCLMFRGNAFKITLCQRCVHAAFQWCVHIR